jgi:hypothetical protein
MRGGAERGKANDGRPFARQQSALGSKRAVEPRQQPALVLPLEFVLPNPQHAPGGLAGIPPLWATGQPLRAAGGLPRSTPPDVGHTPRNRGPVQAGGL